MEGPFFFLITKTNYLLFSKLITFSVALSSCKCSMPELRQRPLRPYIKLLIPSFYPFFTLIVILNVILIRRTLLRHFWERSLRPVAFSGCKITSISPSPYHLLPFFAAKTPKYWRASNIWLKSRCPSRIPHKRLFHSTGGYRTLFYSHCALVLLNLNRSHNV